ncbi:MAG: flagellar biosynthesis protein FlhA [Candidatus Lernaella stagnicola]|nr:flagellar biosynthesis protein FlhA [Candidatus Lernaella stagnicola]
MANGQLIEAPERGRGFDLIMPLGLVLIVVVMVIPIPVFFMDFLLTTSIFLGLLIMLVSLYIERPLDFSSFPTILLMATLFRLALNVATTRLILLHGSEGTDAAGKVIQAFGQFVVGGNYVVGIIVFIVLVIINFVVITKGATRIAEVTARFTLDAMPGKQMSIDADLNSGLIDEQGARERRQQIEQQADFYGAMDGAAKFVRGDAIASIIITLINIIGGIIVGVAQQGMDAATAAENYTLLSVGDGLVSQIPALIISTSAGVIVTRASSRSDLHTAIGEQLMGKARLLFIASGILIFFGLVPGLPFVPFTVLSGAVLVLGLQTRAATRAKLATPLDEYEDDEVPPETVEEVLSMDLIELEVGYGLINLVDMDAGGELLEKIRAIRKQYAQRMGVIIPPIHIRDNLQLKPGQYRILIKSIEVGTGELMPDRLLAMDPGTVDRPIDGIPTVEPAFGLPAVWIRKRDREQAQFAGYTVVDLATVITTHLSEIFRLHSHELLGREEVNHLLENLKKSYPKVIEELVPNLLPLGVVQKVLRNLLREEVSIRDLLTIVETLADFGTLTKDPEVLTEYVRQALGRGISTQFVTDDGSIPLMTFDSRLEQMLSEAVNHTEQGSYLALDPGLAQQIINAVEKSIERFNEVSARPVFLTSPLARGHFKRFIDKFVPGISVLSHNEIDTKARIYSLGVLGV